MRIYFFWNKHGAHWSQVLICILTWQLDQERSMQEKRQQHVLCVLSSFKRHWLFGNLLLEVLFFPFRMSRHARFTFLCFCYIYFLNVWEWVFVGMWSHTCIWCSCGEEKAWRILHSAYTFWVWRLKIGNIIFGHNHIYPLNYLSSLLSVFMLFIFSFYHFYSDINSKKETQKTTKWRI